MRTVLKMIFLWAAVYPLVTAILYAIRATGLEFSIAEQTLILSVPLIPIINLVIAPAAGRAAERAARWAEARCETAERRAALPR